MAAIILFLLFSTFCSVTAQQSPTTNISLGSFLSPDTDPSWLSRSGRFAFGFYQQGNGFAVGVWFTGSPGKTVVWTANRDDPPLSRNDRLLLTNDGRLVLQKTQTPDKPISADTSASYASMLDSGNFVLYNSNSQIIWQTFDSPTNTLLPGQRLLVGKTLFSSVSETNQSTGRFRLVMQGDGNLVQYPTGTPASAPSSYWASATYGRGNNVSLNLDDDGLLYLLNSTGFNIKNLTNGGVSINGTVLYRMTIDVDGIFRLYSNNLEDQNSVWEIQWSSSSNKCDPKGICGLNGYCTLMDQQIACNCLPGFDFVDKNQQTLGCEKKFNTEACKNKKELTRYSMFPLENTVLEDNPYLVLSSTTKGECEGNCLGDCNCEVALFKDGNCSKQKLPARYGRRTLEDSTTTFVKLGTGANDTQAAKESKKDLRKDLSIISVSFFAGALIVLAVSGILLYRNRVWAYKKISEKGDIGLTEDIALRSFTYVELEKVTDGFKEELGRGSFGVVFKGVLSNGGRLVAVKRLENVVREGEREFQNEMRVIGRTHHRNLVRLLGYCHDGPHRLLVYEYMRIGSLADFLFKPEWHSTWDERVGIALDIARGILYLHEECETQIIHCDIKPQNILMDEHLCAKIADFGLAKLLKPDQTRTFTGIRGTRGYVAPEWHRNMPITVKADVYSFGVVFLEIICYRKSVDINASEDKVVLVDWVYDCFSASQLDTLVVDEGVDKKKLERMVRVGLWCIQDEPSLRPSIKKVVLMLEGTVDIPVPPSPTSFLSAI